MSATSETALAVQTVSAAMIEQVLIGGDLSKLTPEQRASYYQAVCQSLGLNPLTKPFEYINLNGKLVLYAKRDCTDQLRSIKNVGVTIVSRERLDGVYVVTARATMPDGRTDESIGAVNIENAKGDTLANALMKAETKAKRRVTLSICGLGMLDETEIETIPAVKVEDTDYSPQKQPPPDHSQPIITDKFPPAYKSNNKILGEAVEDNNFRKAWWANCKAHFNYGVDDVKFILQVESTKQCQLSINDAWEKLLTEYQKSEQQTV